MCEIRMGTNTCSFTVTLMHVLSVIFQLPCLDGRLQLRLSLLLVLKTIPIAEPLLHTIAQQPLLGGCGKLGAAGGGTSPPPPLIRSPAVVSV